MPAAQFDPQTLPDPAFIDGSFNFATDVLDLYAKQPDLKALIWTDTAGNRKDLTYKYYSEQSHAAAALLASYGIKKGDRCIIMCHRVPSWWTITLVRIIPAKVIAN